MVDEGAGLEPGAGFGGTPHTPAWRGWLGLFLGAVVRLWVATLRVSVVAHPSLDRDDPRPWSLAFLHGQQLALLAWARRRPTGVLVSFSKDGAIQSGVMTALGLTVRRGSSSRGGARGLASLVRLLRRGWDAAFAVDGPRGPLGVPKPGVLAAARAARGVVVPMASAARSTHVFTRAWDRFELPLPFSRVAIVLGAPLDPGMTADDLAAELARLRASALHLVRAEARGDGATVGAAGGDEPRIDDIRTSGPALASPRPVAAGVGRVGP